MTKRYISWGRYPSISQKAVSIHWLNQTEQLFEQTPGKFLPFGNGRSYGDCCLTAGILIDTIGIDRFINFDPYTGILSCESGVILRDILDLVVPQGWFLPVTPGTKLVTVGGAIANDVHGKNHHVAGTFGRHVRRFSLLRSDGTFLICSPDENADWYQATIGGLGLTGLILWAEIQLIRVESPSVQVENIRFPNLKAFFDLSSDSDQDYEYTVSWVDCLATGKKLGRGIFMRGNHAKALAHRSSVKPSGLNVPFTPPISLINKISLKIFNELYYHRSRNTVQREVSDYDSFFYPLDKIGNWNRIYGSSGLMQFQCVIPPTAGYNAIQEILDRISRGGQGSFLAVLKVFGNQPSPGMLSFPRPGVTLALDFSYHGEETKRLFRQLIEVVNQSRGAIYPAKDACITAADYIKHFPELEKFKPYKDPAFSSCFWERVSKK